MAKHPEVDFSTSLKTSSQSAGNLISRQRKARGKLHAHATPIFIIIRLIWDHLFLFVTQDSNGRTTTHCCLRADIRDITAQGRSVIHKHCCLTPLQVGREFMLICRKLLKLHRVSLASSLTGITFGVCSAEPGPASAHIRNLKAQSERIKHEKCKTYPSYR